MSDETLRFPSGLTVAQAKKDAKQLRKAEGIPHHEALDHIALRNGIDLPGIRIW